MLKRPVGIYASPSRSTAQIRKRILSFARRSLSDIPQMGESGATTNSAISTLPRQKLCMFAAEGKRSILYISRATANSGFMVSERFISPCISDISSEYSGFLTLATVLSVPSFLAAAQQRMFISSSEVTAISRSALSAPALRSTAIFAPLPSTPAISHLFVISDIAPESVSTMVIS